MVLNNMIKRFLIVNAKYDRHQKMGSEISVHYPFPQISHLHREVRVTREFIPGKLEREEQ